MPHFQPLHLTPERQQQLVSLAHHYTDGLRLARKLRLHPHPTVFASPTSMSVRHHQSATAPVLGLVDASTGSASFSVFSASDDQAELHELCGALLAHHQATQATSSPASSPAAAPLKFAGVSELFAATIASFFSSRRFRTSYYEPCTRMSLRAPPQRLQPLPSDGRYELGELRPSDAQVVDDTWAYRSGHSLGLVDHMIASYPNSCVRLRESGLAVCWVLEYPDGSIGMLHTLPEHRRLGLAKVCVQDLARKVLREGPEVFCFVTGGNDASRQLLSGLGFEPSGQFVWMAFAEGEQAAAAAAGP
jgi:hypothetical protein